MLRRYFTNLDSPVFALVNLPEVVKGALFARYSRTHKSLRRLFLDEFVRDLDIDGDVSLDAREGVGRSTEIYADIFGAFGDDSVSQLGGVHLACEQASILLTKVLERGRLMAYLEQSTRYLRYDHRLTNGRYRYYRVPEIMDSSLGTRFLGDMDRMFDCYASMRTAMQAYYTNRILHTSNVDDLTYRQLVRERSLDAIRGTLPAATISNVGIYGSGQAYEHLVARMRAHPLPEVRDYAKLVLAELRKVIPSFLLYVDDDRAEEASASYIETNRIVMEEVTASLFGENIDAETTVPMVQLTEFDPEGEVKVIAAMLYPYSHLGDAQLVDRVHAMSIDERRQIVQAYVGSRKHPRNRPGRALERTGYRFDICADFGSFRDLQRHRLATVEWQALSPHLGYSMPAPIEDAEVAPLYSEAMERSAELYEVLVDQFPLQAQYAVAFAYRIRYAMQFNAREAMHILELRSGPSGHAAYRSIAQQMHDLIAGQAGHQLLAESMAYVDHTDYETVYASRSAGPKGD